MPFLRVACFTAARWLLIFASHCGTRTFTFWFFMRWSARCFPFFGVSRVEKEACLPEVTIHTKGGTNFDREDSGIEGDQGSASSSESDSPKQRNSLSEIRKTLDRRDKEKELLQNGLAHLSPIDLRRILERRQRINKESFPESPSPTPLASPLRRFYYRSPQKKRQELAKRPPWQSAYSSRPSLRWDPFSGGPERGRPFTNRVPHGGLYRGPLGWSSPIKKGILRPSQAARKVVSKSRQSGAGTCPVIRLLVVNGI